MTSSLQTETERVEAELAADRAGRGGSRWTRLLVAVALAASAAVWAYAIWGPRSTPPGTMDDQAFGEAAEPVCARATAAVDALPLAHETTEPDERADVLDQANAELAAALDDLEGLVALTPEGSEDRRRVTEWLADWRVYLGDRREYADRLRGDRDARFLETEKGGDHLSEALDAFAVKNSMPSCATPGDVA